MSVFLIFKKCENHTKNKKEKFRRIQKNNCGLIYIKLLYVYMLFKLKRKSEITGSPR
jgi:hypothetical protein